MPSDGISVKTTLSQLGNVARSQLKTQAAVPTEGMHKQLADRDGRIDRVRQSEEAGKSRVDPDKKRERRRRRDAEDETAQAQDATDASGDGDEAPAESGEGLGVVVDTKA